MADTPEVPDLKKALENKPAGFAWTPGGTVAKAAASAAAASGRTQAPTMLERLRAQGPGKIALFAVLLLTGGLVFTFAAFRFAGTADGGGGGGALGGVASTMKIRFARQNDPTGFVVREKAAAGEKMRFDLIKGAADKAPGDVTTGGTGVPGGDGGGGAPMNYDEGATSRAGTSGGAGGAGAQGPGKDGGQGGAGGFAGGGGAKLNSSYGSIKFQGMRRVSGTAGFRSIQGGRGNPNKTIQTRGSSANPYGAGAGTNAASGGAAAPGGRGSSAGGIRSNQTAGSAAGGAGAGGGSGSPGGGGGVGDTSTIDDVESTPAKIANLLAEAQSENEKAEDEKKKAIALKAAGQDPQAAYHYDRYRKAKKSADEKAAEADRLTAGMAGAVDGVTVTPNPTPANTVQPD